jgi:hypothetical protein
VEDIIPTYLGDNCHTRILRADGTYARAAVADGPTHRSQYELLQRAAARELESVEAARMPLSFEAISDLTDGNGEVTYVRPKRKNKRNPAR